jgi:flavodoxin
MKNLIIAIMMLLTTNCSSAQDDVNTNEINTGNMKILVVYYSWSGNTEFVANQIKEITGADIFEIELVEPFSTDYSTVAQEYREDNSNGTIRKLKKTVENLSSYDVIFIGAPIWGGTRALPVKSFLHEHDLSGKMVVPFTTHGGGGAGSCFNDMKKEAPNATFLEGLSLTSSQARNSKANVEKWLLNIGVINKSK